MHRASRMFIESLESRTLLSRADLILGDRLQLLNARNQLQTDIQARIDTLRQDRLDIATARQNAPARRQAALATLNSHITQRNTQLASDQQAILAARTSGLAKVNAAIEAVRAAHGNPTDLAAAQQQLALERATMTAQLRSLSQQYQTHARQWKSTITSDQRTLNSFARGGPEVIQAVQQHQSDWFRYREILRVDRRNVAIAWMQLQQDLGQA